MDENRKQAYALLLSAATLHLKWDLYPLWNGLSLWRPWRLRWQSQRVRQAAQRSIVFHNLAQFLTWDFEGFDEDRFWRELDEFRRQFPDDFGDYRRMFERKVAGEDVSVLDLRNYTLGPV